MFSIFRPEPDIFGNDREKDLERIEELKKKINIESHKVSIKDEGMYLRYKKLLNDFSLNGKYKDCIKRINGKLVEFFYDNISANLYKNIYIVDIPSLKKAGGNVEDFLLFDFGKKFFEGNLVLISGLGDRFSKVNKYSILLELISISYMNDIVKYKRYSLFKRMCELNGKYLKWKGMNYRDFI